MGHFSMENPGHVSVEINNHRAALRRGHRAEPTWGSVDGADDAGRNRGGFDRSGAFGGSFGPAPQPCHRGDA